MDTKVSLGSASFVECVKNFYYVDKTRFLKNILDSGTKVYLFTRPRRFGKSTTLSMLHAFAQIDYQKHNLIKNKYPLLSSTESFDAYEHVDCSSKEDLFQKLDIIKEESFCNQYMGQFPVINISFQDAYSLTNPLDCFKKLASTIVSVALALPNFNNSEELEPEEQQAIASIRELNNCTDFLESSANLSSSLKNLIVLLAKYCRKKVILLIDEYDVPLQKITMHIHDLNEDLYNRSEDYATSYKENLLGEIKLFKSFINCYTSMLSEALKGNDTYLKQAIVAGCLKVGKQSIFTGLNNLVVADFDKAEFSKLFGFTESEVKKFLNSLDKKHTTSELFANCKAWYDGYNFASTEIYSPWDISNYIEQIIKSGDTKPNAYWINTSSINELKRLYKKYNSVISEKMELLIQNKSVKIKILDYLNYDVIEENKDENVFWNLMYATGYLTKVADCEDNYIEVKIPNLCIHKCFEDVLKLVFSTKDTDFSSKALPLVDNFFNGLDRKLSEDLNVLLQRYVSFYDISSNSPKEMYYQGFFNGLFSQLLNDSNSYDYKANGELNEGRADISFVLQILTKSQDCVGVIIELKACQNRGQLNLAAKSAVEQIEDRDYVKGFIAQHPELLKVQCYGISFFKKSCVIQHKEIICN